MSQQQHTLHHRMLNIFQCQNHAAMTSFIDLFQKLMPSPTHILLGLRPDSSKIFL